MSRHIAHRILTRIPPLLLLVSLATAIYMIGSARAQLATAPPNITPLELLELKESGTFDVWQGGTLLGTEKYETYVSLTGDSLITLSSVAYTLGVGRDTSGYEKYAILIDGALDSYPLFYQTMERVGEERRAMRVAVADTTAEIFREGGDSGVGSVMEIPRGRFFIFDPSVYHHVEILLGRFARRSIESRSYQVLVPANETILELRAVRGDEEKTQLADGEEREAIKMELSDELTRFEAWMDEGGRLLRLEAKAQGIKVVRHPDKETPDS
jgi:hypothetical protein